MRYDDRLATVLRLTPVGPNVARIQFRQLLDLLGTRPAEDHGEMLDLAYLRLAELSARIPAQDRAVILRQGGHRLRSPRLVATLAQAETVVASAAIRAAQLTPDQWLDLIPALPLASRGLLRDRDDLGPEARALLARLGIGDRALEGEAPTPASQSVPEAPAPPQALGLAAAAPMAEDTIGALVRRIEAFRQARENGAVLAEAPPLPLGLEPLGSRQVTSFDFASDGDGRIVWSESQVAPMVVGHALGRGNAAGAVRLHQPLRAAMVTLVGAAAIAGDWQVDAVPRFDPLGGRYIGHIGRFRRPAPAALAPVIAPPADSEADRLRQLLHELRTPVNAIQGFAEIIQQQLFGPTPHEYRALAAAVAADSARILAGFEELDRFAKLDSGAQDLAGGACDLATCLAATVAGLQPESGQSGPRFRLESPPSVAVRMVEEEAEHLIWRLLAIIAGNAQNGENLPIALIGGPMPTLHMTLPAALAGMDNAALYHAAAQSEGQAPSAGMFGTGFSLRLAGVEARAAGGTLVRHGAALVLTLPGLTPDAGDPSHGSTAA